MTFSSEFIDEIVRNVMRELSLPPTSDSAAPSSTAAGDAVVLSDSVITEDILADQQLTGQTVLLSPNAVITPSGRDYIRRHRLSVSSDAAASCPSGGLVLIVGDAPNLTAAAKSAGWDTDEVCSGFEAARRAAHGAGGSPVVCSSDQPSVIACLINRDGSRRAAVLTADTCLTQLLGEMNPDTLCLSPTGWSFGQLMRLLKRIGGHRTDVPAGWKELS